jgi:hypothetical protein
LCRAIWTLGYLLDGGGDLIERLGQDFISIRELPPVIAFAVWVFGEASTSVIALLALGLARSSNLCREAFLWLLPFLILGEGLSSCIDIRGHDGIHYVQSILAEYAVSFCFWCLFAWPYVFAHRFYRSTSSDVLFSDTDALRDDTDEHIT